MERGSPAGEKRRMHRTCLMGYFVSFEGIFDPLDLVRCLKIQSNDNWLIIHEHRHFHLMKDRGGGDKNETVDVFRADRSQFEIQPKTDAHTMSIQRASNHRIIWLADESIAWSS